MADFVIVVAGGVGKRMGADVPKQFLLLSGKPLLMHTLQVFYTYNPDMKLILTLPKEHIEYWTKICKEYFFDVPHKVVEGGERRFDSVKNGLSAVNSKEGLVAIHDGVRPLVSRDTLDRCFEGARKNGNSIPVMGVVESLRMKQNQDSAPVDRDLYYTVQTPQVFKIPAILKAYEQAYHPSFTDDATVVERTGVKIELVKGNKENIKITSPLDLVMAETILKSIK